RKHQDYSEPGPDRPLPAVFGVTLSGILAISGQRVARQGTPLAGFGAGGSAGVKCAAAHMCSLAGKSPATGRGFVKPVIVGCDRANAARAPSSLTPASA